jgi:hypothetical protein
MGVPIDCGNPEASRKDVWKEYDDTAPPANPEGGRERGMKVRVVCYEGYQAEETPRAFFLGESRVEVVRVLDRWRGQDHEYVKLDGSDGARYILRHDRAKDEWEIQMMEAPPA